MSAYGTFSSVPATSNGSASSAPSSAPPGRFANQRLRRASWISPVTGERSKRVFTLRDASHRNNENHNDHDEDASPIQGNGSTRRHPDTHIWSRAYHHVHHFVRGLDTAAGRGILKCSLAYLLGSLVTFVPALAALIGSGQDSKHMVATVTVWFHPARTIGSMHLATILATLGFIYSCIMGFSSMAVSMFFGNQDLLAAGHGLILVVWIGAGLGFVAWTKQYFGDPLINVACSLASLGCITVLIKEGSVQAGEFSEDRVIQVLLMVLMGIFVSTAVNTFVLPTTARTQMKDDLEKNTDLLGEMLVCITRAFLSGRESDLSDEYFTGLQKEHQQSLQKMEKDLRESRNEFFALGNERLYEVVARLAECLDGLAQDLGGLRSAALAQFALVNGQTEHHANTDPSSSQAGRPNGSTSPVVKPNIPNILDVIAEAAEENGDLVADVQSAMDPSLSALERQTSITSIASTLKTPDDMFTTFITQLGPPTKSLVFTLKQILDELPFAVPESAESESRTGFLGLFRPKIEVAINQHFHSSLKEAVELYRVSRKHALETLYASRAVNAAFMPPGVRKAVGAFSGQRTPSTEMPNPVEARIANKSSHGKPQEDILADIEEVSACCGHFSFSLLDFAEDVTSYLTILDDLKATLDHPSLTWNWLLSWRFPWQKTASRKTFAQAVDHEDDAVEHGIAHEIPEPIRKADAFATPLASRQRWTRRLYHHLHLLRRDDVKFAIKVGLGAVLYSLPAFVPTTRPTFVYWRGEWGLVSYMAVCCMTIGAVNTTGINRFIGTFIGALLAVIAWVISSNHGDANPWLLAFFGWAVSTGCFYLILAKQQGPMGRFILLTYNLGALYAYSLSVHDDDHDDDEGGIDPAIFDIVLHRVVAVVVGTIWAMVIVRFVWPISARRKLKDGLCLLWLRMALIWKRDPLAIFLLGEPRSKYMDIREEASLHAYLTHLDDMRAAASSEFELRGPFPDGPVANMLSRTRNMLDAFHALNVVIGNSSQYTAGEAAVLRFTRRERSALSARISHLFSVLASSYKLEFPLNDAMPDIENSRDRLLARISEFRRTGEGRESAAESDYELLYAYVLVTGQLGREIAVVGAELEGLFGRLDEEGLGLW